MVPPIALQLYTVRHALEVDASRTLKRIREAGFQWVETAPLPPTLSASHLATLLRDHGLSVSSVHCDLPVGDRQNQVFEEAERLGSRRIVWHGWPKVSSFESVDGLKFLRDQYTAAAQSANSHGFQLGLHNHWWEFEPIQGICPYEWMHRHLPPQIFFQLDVYWVQTAGLDPAQILRTYSDRVRMLHLKDGPAIHAQPMTALGDGIVDIQSIIQTPQDTWAWVIELDECATDPFDAARRSLDFLNRLTPPLSSSP